MHSLRHKQTDVQVVPDVVLYAVGRGGCCGRLVSVLIFAQTQKQTFEVLYIKTMFIWKYVGVSVACPDDPCFVR